MKSIYEVITENLNGCTFISVDTETSVATSHSLANGKFNPHHNKVTKQTIGMNVMIAQYKTTNAYENMVNKRLEKEGKAPTFKSYGLTWGKRVPNTPFVEHKGQLYLQVICMHPGSQVYLLDGVPYPKQKIQGIKIPRGNPQTVKDSQKRLEDKVIVRVYNVKNIKKIVINGKVLIAGVDFDPRDPR